MLYYRRGRRYIHVTNTVISFANWGMALLKGKYTGAVTSFCLAALLVSGCSLADRFGGRSARIAAAPVQTSGRLDSLWNSALKADTLFLSKEISSPGASLLPDSPPLRRGPASVVVLSPDTVWGWRVQLASAADKKTLEALVSRVEREFGASAYVDRIESGYALRIGAFAGMEAAADERDRAVSYGYKNAWIVQTRIPPHQFKREE